jgi:hypothetical protein
MIKKSLESKRSKSHTWAPLSKDDLQSIRAVQYQLVREDPFAEMATSFQTRQAAACDGEVLNLNCPSGTKVWFGF